MDKKVYNKPTLKLEVFTPNEYIASCWYIAEGDCYSSVIYKDNDESFQIKNLPESINAGHDSHRVPASGYFKTGEPSYTNLENTSIYWWIGGDFNNINGNSPQSWSTHGWERIKGYYSYKDSNETMHYFKKITNDNYTS